MIYIFENKKASAVIFDGTEQVFEDEFVGMLTDHLSTPSEVSFCHRHGRCVAHAGYYSFKQTFRSGPFQRLESSYRDDSVPAGAEYAFDRVKTPCQWHKAFITADNIDNIVKQANDKGLDISVTNS